MNNLEFKAKNIRKMERETGLNFLESLDNFGSISGIIDIMMAGGMTEDEASDALDQYGFEEVILKIMERLSECGFLPQEARISMKESLKQMKKDFKKIEEETSAKTGEKTNQEPSK
ncbi:MAG: hypothetical protein Q4A27_00075 [bacterium]|nr:hypothetical protein [bacterium]